MQNKYVIGQSMTVKDVISYMDENSLNAVVIVNDNNIVQGLFSLGDMRRFFIQNGNLQDNITNAMNKTPIVFHSVYEAERCEKELVIYPVVSEDGTIVEVIEQGNKDIQSDVLSDVPVVIMAGGKGTRLYPYTKILPKALIPIGDYTITERIIKSFQKFGCKDFYMILKHKAGMIKSYFNDLQRTYNIYFEEEKDFMGTGGGLIYLKGKINNTFFLSNCDILINADLECAYKTHKAQGNKITFVCAMKDVDIPYGVLETDDNGKVLNMKEKPQISFLTNTGLYVIEPEVIDELKEGEFIHLPDIAQRYMDKGEKVGVFPISEKSWMDMGQFSEMESMIKALGV